MRSDSIENDPLREAGLRFLQDEDLDQFMNHSFHWMQAYVRSGLNHDHDIAGDFLLYFYERIVPILKRYETRQNRPFTAYLCKCMRFEFYNFQRKKKRKSLSHFLVADVEETYITPHSRATKRIEKKSDSVAEIRSSIGYLPENIQIVLKLYYGIPLTITDYRNIYDRLEHPAKLAEISATFESRTTKRIAKLIVLHDRLRRLEYLIQEDRAEETSRNRMIQRWKSRIRKKIQSDWPVFKLSEIAELLQVSRSTIYRRFERGHSLLREDSTLKGEDRDAIL